MKASSAAAGLYHSMVLGTNGNVYTFGYDGNGELGINTDVNSSTPVVAEMPSGVSTTAVAAGFYNSYALTSNGSLYAWGFNGSGQLGNGTTAHSGCPPRSVSRATRPSPADERLLVAIAIAIATPSQSMTTTMLSASNNSPVYGQAETLTATVTGSDGGGTVNFKDGSSSLSGCASVSLTQSGSNYVAQCTTSTLSAAQHNFTAIYSGDATPRAAHRRSTRSRSRRRRW